MGKCTHSALLMFFCCVKDALCLGNFIRSRPTADEVAEAQGIFDAAEKHQQGGVGAFAHNGKMVDVPVVERAKRILRLNKLYAPKETS